MENESDDGLLFYRFSTTLCNVIENAAFLRLSVYMSTVRTVSIMGFTFCLLSIFLKCVMHNLNFSVKLD